MLTEKHLSLVGGRQLVRGMLIGAEYLDRESYLSDEEKADFARSVACEEFLDEWKLRLHRGSVRDIQLEITRAAFARTHGSAAATLSKRDTRSWLDYFGVDDPYDLEAVYGEIDEDALAIELHDYTDEEDINAIESHFGLPADVRSQIQSLLEAYYRVIIVSVDEDLDDVAMFGFLENRDLSTLIARWGTGVAVPQTAKEASELLEAKGRKEEFASVGFPAVMYGVVIALATWVSVQMFWWIDGYPMLKRLFQKPQDVDTVIYWLGGAHVPALVIAAGLLAALVFYQIHSARRTDVHDEIRAKFPNYEWYIT